MSPSTFVYGWLTSLFLSLVAVIGTALSENSKGNLELLFQPCADLGLRFPFLQRGWDRVRENTDAKSNVFLLFVGCCALPSAFIFSVTMHLRRRILTRLRTYRYRRLTENAAIRRRLDELEAEQTRLDRVRHVRRLRDIAHEREALEEILEKSIRREIEGLV